MEAPEISWRPLGRLLVDKGLLTEERLEEALAAQAKTEGRLGDTLVELGYVSRSSLARALAEQYGMELTVETGFGSGLQARIERRHDESNAWQLASGPQSNQELPPLVLVQPVEEPPAPVEDTSTQMAALEEQWAKLAAAEDRVAEIERELDNVRANAGRREAQVVRFVDRVRRRDARIADLSTAGPEVDAQATTDDRLAELQSELEAVRATAERRQAQVVRFVGHVRRRDAQIAELSAAATDVDAEAASDNRLAELQSELDAVRGDAERRQAQVVRFVGRVRRRDAQIAELSTAGPDVDALAAAEAHAAELQGQLDELSADAGQRQAQVSRFGRGRKRDAQTAELAAAEEEVARLGEEVQRRDEQIGATERELAELREARESFDTKIEDLVEQVRRRDEQIDAVERELAEAGASLEALSAGATERDAEVEALAGQLRQRDEQLGETDRELTELREARAALESRIEQLLRRRGGADSIPRGDRA